MTKYNFKPGTKIRSYDFAGNNECYIEGRVVSVGESHITLEVENEVWCGEPSAKLIGSYVKTSVYKNPLHTKRIVKIK